MKLNFPIIRCCLCVAITAGLILTPNVSILNAATTLNNYMDLETQQNEFNVQVADTQDKLKTLQSDFSALRTSEVNYLDAIAVKDAFTNCPTALSFDAAPLELLNGQWSSKEYYLSLADCDGLLVTIKTNDIPGTLDYIDSLNLLVTDCTITNDTVQLTICIKEGVK